MGKKTTAQPELEADMTSENLPVAAQPAALAATHDDFMLDDAGEGFENTTAADYMVASIKLAQSLSPELKRNNAEHIEGLEEGQIFNSITKDIYGDSVRVIPCLYTREAVEWKANRGGFAGTHPVSFIQSSKAVRNDKGEWVLPGGGGNYLVETSKFFVLFEGPDGEWHPATITFKITGAKAARKWMTLASQQLIKTPQGVKERPLYGVIYTLTAAEQSKGQNTWFTFVVDVDCLVGDPGLYARAKAFREMAKTGAVLTEEEATGGSEQPAGADIDNDLM